MTVQSVLADGRAAAVARMLDTCRITRTPNGDLDEDSGTYDGAPTTIYEGPCRIVLDSQDTTESDAQSQLLTEQGPRLDIPHTAPEGSTGDPGAVTTDDEALILTSATDPALVDLRARIAGEFPHSQATARRFPIEVTTGG